MVHHDVVTPLRAPGLPAIAHFDAAAVRAAEFPWAEKAVYLNHASIGPLPESSRAATEDFNRDRAAPLALSDALLTGIFTEARAKIGQLIGADSTEIALASNTSYGLNLAAQMLPLEAGDIVVVPNREFPANVYPWKHLRRKGVELDLAPLTPEGWPDEEYLLDRIQDPRVRVLSVSLVQFSNGYHVDLARLSAATRATGTYLVVDAIQGVGQVPLDVRHTPVDILACGAQKWLLAPWGTGFLYVRKELVTRLIPPFAGWTAFEGMDDYSNLVCYDDRFLSDARRFELITLPYQDFVGMLRSLDLLLSLGIGSIAAHLRGLHEPVLEWASRSGAKVTSPTDRCGSGILCVVPRKMDRSLDALRGAGVAFSLREGAIRLSPHCYNTMNDMERVVDLLNRAE